MRKLKIDWFLFISTFALLIAICLPLVFNPEKGSEIVNVANKFVTQNFGFIFLWAGLGCFVLLIFLSVTNLGKIKFGSKAEKPEFSNFSWGAMLFSSGVASGLLYWGAIEWAYYFTAPPYGIEPRSTAAAELAAAYGVFHWGPSAWAFYVLPALPIAYSYYILKKPILKLSEACRIILGKHTDGMIGKVIDLIFMFGILGAAGTSLGLGTPLVAAGISKMTGVEESLALNMFVLMLCTAIFSWSAYSGLKRGLKWLSNLAIILSFVLLGFILLVGPTVFMLKTGTNSIGLVLTNFVRWSTFTDPIANEGFVEGWTIFYWAWWIVYTPFMGLFIAKISRGRTIRQVILGGLSWGSLGCTLYFTVLGNYSMYLELNNILSVTSLLTQIGAPATIMQTVSTLPLGSVVVALFSFVALIFLATTFDSASYMMASAATLQIRADEEPAKWNRLFWALTLFILPATLMLLGGDLQTVQTASILTALPFVFVILLLSLSFMKMVKTGAHLQENSTEKSSDFVNRSSQEEIEDAVNTLIDEKQVNLLIEKTHIR